MESQQDFWIFYFQKNLFEMNGRLNTGKKMDTFSIFVQCTFTYIQRRRVFTHQRLFYLSKEEKKPFFVFAFYFHFYTFQTLLWTDRAALEFKCNGKLTLKMFSECTKMRMFVYTRMLRTQWFLTNIMLILTILVNYYAVFYVQKHIVLVPVIHNHFYLGKLYII